jgi:hypothetical protein
LRQIDRARRFSRPLHGAVIVAPAQAQDADKVLKAMSDYVEGFGCRPVVVAAGGLAAGVRKPAMEETRWGKVGGAAYAMGI